MSSSDSDHGQGQGREERGKILPFRRHRSEPGAQDQADVIAALEELLEGAKKGEFTGVAIAAVHSDRLISTIYIPGPARASDLHWALAQLQRRILDDVSVWEED